MVIHARTTAEEEDQQEEEEQRGSGDSDENLAKIAANVSGQLFHFDLSFDY